MTNAWLLDPDTALMLRVREGDRSSFDTLVSRHRAGVVNHIYRMVLDRTAAEELAQDAFVRLYRLRSRYEPTAKVTTLLFRIATNLALNWRRDRRFEAAYARIDDPGEGRTQRSLPDHRPGADEMLIRREQAEHIRKMVHQLYRHQIAAVMMHK